MHLVKMFCSVERQIDFLYIQAEEMGEQAEKASGPSLDRFLGQLSNKACQIS